MKQQAKQAEAKKQGELEEKEEFTQAAPAITLPKGGGAIRGMGEKFAAAAIQIQQGRNSGNDQRTGAASLENLPIGLDGSHYQWVDLDGEGVTGILGCAMPIN